MLGGGKFTSQNKTLPGAYINFVSAQKVSSNLGERGVAALAVEMDWGPDGEVFEVTSGDFSKSSQRIFGYSNGSEKLKGIRDLFLNARRVYFYKLNNGVKASNSYCTAKYKGVRGNSLKTVVATNVDDSAKFDVMTYLDNILVDTQVVAAASALVFNDYVDFKSDATLSLTAGVSLAGGTNGAVTGADYKTALDKFESYSFNALGCVSEEEEVKGLLSAYTMRMRDEVGVKFQCVLHKYTNADHEGVVSVENNTTAELVYWTLGAIAGCAVNASNLNKVYDGEFAVDTDYTQSQLEATTKVGKFVFHKVGNDVRVLEDINTLMTTTEEKGEDFKSNQTVRVLDQIGNDIAQLFNKKYLGAIPNDDAGRVSLWNDIVKHHQSLQAIRAIENFSDGDIAVEAGATKKVVLVSDKVTPTNCMAQLYMTVVVQ